MTDEARRAKAEYEKRYRAENREKLNQYRRDWNRRNPERLKKYRDRYWNKKAGENA